MITRSKLITHNTYEADAVQSLGAYAHEHDYTVGIMMPGKYSFGPALYRGEKITLLVGFAIINGNRFAAGGTATISVGDPIDIEIEGDQPAIYLCQYGQQEGGDA